MKSKENAYDSIAEQLNTARNLIRYENISGAERILNSVLAKNRKNAEVLGLLATAVYLRGDKKHSKILWKQSLDNPAQPLIFLANLHAFLRALLMEKNQAAAVKHASRRLPQWPVAQIPSISERDMLIELANMLAMLDKLDSAHGLLENLSKALPADNKLAVSLGLMQMMCSKFSAALKTFTAVDRAIQPNTDLSLLVKIYLCAIALNDEELRRSLIDRVTNTYPVHVAPKLSGQTKNILIVYRAPNLSNSKISDVGDLFSGNYPSQLSKRLAKEFHFSAIFSNAEGGGKSKYNLPTPDLIISNIANGEKIAEEGNLSIHANFVEGFHIPVVNHPRKVISTTREQTARLLNEIPGVLVPSTVLFSKSQKSEIELISEIEANFDYPLITRTLHKQQGEGMSKIDDHDSLVRALPVTPDKFYVTQFVENRDESGFYRKMRAAIVGDEIYVVRVDYDTHWNVHGRKSDERVRFYMDNPHLLVTEDRICSNPGIELGPSIMQSLGEIRQRIPLEIFGIDFDITNNGAILFYEANAAMNLLSTAQAAVNHPAHAEERLLSAISRYLHALGNNAS